MAEHENPVTSAMPTNLADAVNRLDRTHKSAAMNGWDDAGPDGRREYGDFIRGGDRGWGRRLRCQLALRRLIRAAAPWL